MNQGRTQSIAACTLTVCILPHPGSVRYWAGAGPGGFAISSTECLRSSFYCICFTPPDYKPFREVFDGSEDEFPHLKGWNVISSTVPVKDPYFSTIKSNNYLPNVLCKMDAESRGGDQVGGLHAPSTDPPDHSNTRLPLLSGRPCCKELRAVLLAACLAQPKN